jgi:aminoglycoside phosphotransferase (APT) family kinase protein
MPFPCEGAVVSPPAAGGWFLLKADIDVPDLELRLLRDPSAPAAPPAPDGLVALAVARTIGVAPQGPPSEVLRGTFHWVMPMTLVDGRRVMVRLNRIRHPALREGVVVEERIAVLLARHAVPTAAVLGIDLECRTLPSEMLVTERIEGTSLASAEGNEAAMLAGLRALGALLRSVHEVELEGSGPTEALPDGGIAGRFEAWDSFLACRLGEHLRSCMEAGALPERDAARVAATFERWTTGGGVPTNRLLHGDPGPSNVLTAPDGTAQLVDWEDAQVGDPLFELASAAAFHPQRRWGALFEGYGWRPMGSDDVRRFWLYMLRIALARTVMRARFALTDLPDRSPAADRVRRALTGIEHGETP